MRYNQHLMVRVDQELIDHLDSVRGPMTRSEFVRQAIAGSRPHRHERKRITRRIFINGVETPVWGCDCGQEMT